MVLESLVTGSTLPRRRLLTARAAGQDTLVSDPDSGQVHFLNAAATLVWDCCDGQTTAAACIARLRAAFAVPPDADVAADIQAVLSDLEKRGLLAGDPARG